MHYKPLTQEEKAWLIRLESSVDKYWDELTDFEKKFLETLLERFRQYGMKTIVSPKQWEIITRISEKII